jgi:hypothetical protein
MTRLLVWSVAVTALQVSALLGVVHTLLRHAMLARGLPTWRVGDTLLTSPVLWIGATVTVASITRLVALAALRAEGNGPSLGGGTGATVAVALLGVVMAWFGLRAVGKLY